MRSTRHARRRALIKTALRNTITIYRGVGFRALAHISSGFIGENYRAFTGAERKKKIKNKKELFGPNHPCVVGFEVNIMRVQFAILLRT